MTQAETDIYVRTQIFGQGYIFSISLPLEKLNVSNLAYFLLVSEEALRVGLLTEGEGGWAFETPDRGLNFYLIDKIRESEAEEVTISLDFVNKEVIEIITNVRECGGNFEKATRRAIPLLRKFRSLISPPQLDS